MLRKFAAILLTLVAVLAAGWLALKRPDIPYEALEASYSVEDSRFLTLSDDVKLHYTDTGPRDAPVLVLVHGFAASLHTWQPWARRLDETYRIVTLDLPGHGLSRVPEDGVSISYYVDTVDALADRLSLETFSLAGSSMGGNVAWQYALAHPEKLDSLILVDAAGWPSSDTANTPLVFKLLRIPVVRTLMKDLDLSALIRDGLEDSFADPQLVTEEMAERYAALSRAPGHRAALLNLSAGSGQREKASPERLAEISVPTLILWGEQDNLIPVGHAAKFEDAIPGAVAITYPDAGHVPQEELAAESARDLQAFLDRTVASADPGEIMPVSTDLTEMRSSNSTPTASGGGMRPR